MHPNCRNVSNPYHECVDFYFKLVEAEHLKEIEEIKNEDNHQIDVPDLKFTLKAISQ